MEAASLMLTSFNYLKNFESSSTLYWSVSSKKKRTIVKLKQEIFKCGSMKNTKDYKTM
jgi:hypothetical protein